MSAYPLEGDYADDDGIAIDQSFEAAYHGPVETDTLEPEEPAIKATTRLITATMPVIQNAAPVMLLPADPNRVDLIILCGDQGVRIASEQNLATFAPVLVLNTQWQSTKHTGAVWVYTTGTTTTVSAWAVTC